MAADPAREPCSPALIARAAVQAGAGPLLAASGQGKALAIDLLSGGMRTESSRRAHLAGLARWMQHNVSRGQSAKHQGTGKMTTVLQSLSRIGAGRHDSAPGHA